jgi:hypothetical protein
VCDRWALTIERHRISVSSVTLTLCSLCELFYYKTPLTSFRAANPNINLDIPVINKFTPTNVPIAHTELDGQ